MSHDELAKYEDMVEDIKVDMDDLEESKKKDNNSHMKLSHKQAGYIIHFMNSNVLYVDFSFFFS